MKKKYPNSYAFPAILESGERNYSVYFPDLPGCVSSGDTIQEAIKEAKEALSLHLWGMEQDEDDIPTPSDFSVLQNEIENNDIICYIDVNMFGIRAEMNNKPVKKTLTIPYYLNELAEKQRINFSQLLQSALKKRLGV